MKVAVLGGGNGCYATAVDLTEDGHEVRLWRRDGDAFGILAHFDIGEVFKVVQLKNGNAPGAPVADDDPVLGFRKRHRVWIRTRVH